MGRREGRSFLERTADAFDIPADAVAGLPRIEITGNRELMIENHRGILEYDENLIRINGGRLMIVITGQNLVITAMNQSELAVAGEIAGIELETV